MLKKILMVFAGGVVSLSLAGCGSSTENELSDKESEKPVASTSTETKENTSDTSNEEEAKVETLSYVDVLKEILPQASGGYLELSNESYDFIKENSELFPAKADADIKMVKERSEALDIKLLNKNVSPYYKTITSYEGYVLQISEETNGEDTAAELNIFDDEGNSYSLLIFKSTGDILEEDYVRFWGVPVGAYSYETLDGGYQNAQIFFGSHIEKVQ